MSKNIKLRNNTIATGIMLFVFVVISMYLYVEAYMRISGWYVLFGLVITFLIKHIFAPVFFSNYDRLKQCQTSSNLPKNY